MGKIPGDWERYSENNNMLKYNPALKFIHQFIYGNDMEIISKQAGLRRATLEFPL